MTLFTPLKADFKSIIREPVIALITLAPLFMVLFFKVLVVYLLPLVIDYIPADIAILSYVLTTLLLATPIMMGVVMGFLMLDDRDGRMIELYYVTPLGASGYLIHRLLFSFILTFFYTNLNYAILGIYTLSIFKLQYIAMLGSIFAASTGLFFFSLASDKIKGLTYAKGMNMLIIFAYSELLDVRWFYYLSAIFPSYWLSHMIRGGAAYIQGTVVACLWLVVLIYFTFKRQKLN